MHSRQTPTLFQSDGLEYSVRSSAHDRALARFADFERAKARFVREVAAAEISATRGAGGRVIPVGTTALRLIETAARETGEIRPFEGDTDIFIYPGFEFRVTDALMTNFHLPKSTLMMLVSALMGRDRMMEIYAHAVAERYRFFSYGDASLLIPAPRDARP